MTGHTALCSRQGLCHSGGTTLSRSAGKYEGRGSVRISNGKIYIHYFVIDNNNYEFLQSGYSKLRKENNLAAYAMREGIMQPYTWYIEGSLVYDA